MFDRGHEAIRRPDTTRVNVDTLDTARIEALIERLFEVESWEELLKG